MAKELKLDPEWSGLEEQFLSLTTQKNQLDAAIRNVRDQMEVISDGEDVFGERLSLRHTSRRGLVQYKEIPAVVAMTTEELDAFRKPTTTSVVVKVLT